MALTAQIFLSKAGVLAEQTVMVTCLITNPTAGALNVNYVNPIGVVYGTTSQAVGLAMGVPQVGGEFPSVIPAGGTMSVSWGVTPHAPTTNLPVGEPAQVTYSIGAEILANDGSDNYALPALLTVVGPQLSVLAPTQGQLVFNNPSNSALAL
jgi:hypothetical protein